MRLAFGGRLLPGAHKVDICAVLDAGEPVQYGSLAIVMQAYSLACSGLKIACMGSYVVPSEIWANATFFCFLMLRMRP